MSINVTVTGNPVSIKRGKMVTADSAYAKKDFDKRRKMRLAQVRQQSNNIAENVRRKVQKEKEKQLSEIEQKGADKLEKWKNRKLLELQEQYCESLKDLGLGHAQAKVEETHEEIAQAYKQTLQEKSKQRSQIAAKVLHDQQQQKELNRISRERQRKLVKNADNLKSRHVSQKSPFKKKKRKKSVLNVSKASDSESDFSSSSDNNVPLLSIPTVEYETTSSRFEGGQRLRTKSTSTDSESTSSLSQRKSSPVTSPKKGLSRTESSSPNRPRSPVKMADVIVHAPMDTRISDRIRNRRLPSFTDPVEILEEETITGQTNLRANNIVSSDIIIDTDQFPSEIKTQICKCCYKCKCQSTTDNLEVPNSPKKKQQVKQTTSRSPQKPCCLQSKYNCRCKTTQIPSKPTIRLKSVQKEAKASKSDLNRVQYYDHVNKFAKEYTYEPQVEKIHEENLEIINEPNDKEYRDRIHQRDREAQIRGKVAYDKDKIQKDYKELMETLPILQRQERIASINANKPSYHMGNKRLKEHEFKKQNKMENAYEKLFPNSVTIPPKKHVIDDKPFKTIDIKGDDQSDPCLNLAQWDLQSPIKDGVIVTKDDGVITVNGRVSNQTDALRYMFEKLKKQKELLMKEVKTLPRDSKLDGIISDLENLKDLHESLSPKPPATAVQLPPVSVATSSNSDLGNHLRIVHGVKTGQDRATQHGRETEQDRETQRDIETQRDKKTQHDRTTLSKQGIDASASTEDNIIPKKKVRHRIHRVILQNTSTQTSPKITGSPQKSNTSRKRSPSKSLRSSSPISTKIIMDSLEEKAATPMKGTEKSCPCLKEDEVCEILIKIKDDEEPEIKIKSPKKATKTIARERVLPEKIPSKLFKDVFPCPKKHDVDKRTVRISENNSLPSRTSWKEHLSRISKNDTVGTSSSTSYYSPPDFPKALTTQLSNVSNAKEQQNFLPKNLDPRLVTYIKKLLSMSRASIDDLGVSTATDVSGTSSLANSVHGEPLNQLKTVMKFFNLSSNDLAKCLYYSDESSPEVSESQTSGSNHYEASRSNVNTASLPLEVATSQEDEIYDKQLAEAAEKYQTMANQCHERISNLTAMIEKVRQEKKDMLSPSFSDKENSTTYLNLPSQLGRQTPQSNERSSLDHLLVPDNSARQTQVGTIIVDNPYDDFGKQGSRPPCQQLNNFECAGRTELSSGMFRKEEQRGQSPDNLIGRNFAASGAKYRDSDDKVIHPPNSRGFLSTNDFIKQFNAQNYLKEQTSVRFRDDLPHYERREQSESHGTSDKDVKSEFPSNIRKLLPQDTKRMLPDDGRLPFPDNERTSPDNSKSYFQNIQRTSPEPSRRSPSPNSEQEQRELNRQLLDINIDVSNIKDQRLDVRTEMKTPTDLDHEIYERYRRLVAIELEHSGKKSKLDCDEKLSRRIAISTVTVDTGRPNEIPYVPILLDIPRLPKLPHHENGDLGKAKKPPPAKGLTAAKKFNGNIDNTPHELSTIMEVDSQLSARASSLSPQKTDENYFDDLRPLIVVPESKNSAEAQIADESLPDIVTELLVSEDTTSSLSTANKTAQSHSSKRYKVKMKKDESTDSSTDKSDMENIEAMLVSMGMGWAVATLKKTQQALIRASSTSSTDERQKDNRGTDTSSTSDVTLRDAMGKKIFNNSTGTSSSPFSKEFEEISVIQGSGLSSEHKNQRTSTPVQTAKSTSEKSKDRAVFSVESEISSVKSSEDAFATIPAGESVDYPEDLIEGENNENGYRQELDDVEVEEEGTLSSEELNREYLRFHEEFDVFYDLRKDFQGEGEG